MLNCFQILSLIDVSPPKVYECHPFQQIQQRRSGACDLKSTIPVFPTSVNDDTIHICLHCHLKNLNNNPRLHDENDKRFWIIWPFGVCLSEKGNDWQSSFLRTRTQCQCYCCFPQERGNIGIAIERIYTLQSWWISMMLRWVC